MPRRRQPTVPTFPPATVVDEVVLHDDGVWVLARGRLSTTGATVGVRRPSQPSSRAGALLAAEHRLLTIVGTGPLPEPVGLVVDDAGTVTALLIRPAPAAALHRADHPDRGLDAGQVATVVTAVADGLARLHAAGFVHAGVDAHAVTVDDEGGAMLAALGTARRRSSGRARPTDDVAALGALGLTLLGPDAIASADDQALRAVLGRLLDPDPLRRPAAATAAAVLRRSGPTPRPLPAAAGAPIATRTTTSATDTDPPAVAPIATRTTTSATDTDPAAGSPVGDGAAAPATTTDRMTEWGGHRPVEPVPARHRESDRHTRSWPPRRPDHSTGSDARTSSQHHRPPGHRRRMALGVLGMVLMATGVGRLRSGVMPATSTSPTPTPCALAGGPALPPGATAAQVDVDGRGCTVPVHWLADRGEVVVVTPEGERHYGIGQAGDQLVVADWDCDGDATPLLRRPSAGEAWRFDGWPTDDRPVLPTAVPMTLVPPTC